MTNFTRKLLQRVKEGVKNTRTFVRKNRLVQWGITGITLGLGLRSFFTFEELAQICAESSLVTTCGNAVTKRTLQILLEELQRLPGCEVSIQNLHQVVEDSEILDSEKEKQAELVLLAIEQMTNLDLKHAMIVCFVLTVSNLYFSNIIGFNILTKALINALKKGKLSSRIFHIILRMLANRGIPIDEILEAVE